MVLMTKRKCLDCDAEMSIGQRFSANNYAQYYQHGGGGNFSMMLLGAKEGEREEKSTKKMET